MPYQFELLKDESILITTFSGQLNAAELREWWQAVDEQSAALGRGYHIIDIRSLGLDLNGMFGLGREQWVQEAVRRFPNFPLAPVVVAHESLSRIAASAMRQPDYNHLLVPIFANHDEALAYIRGQKQ
jgi:hypothetical protein